MKSGGWGRAGARLGRWGWLFGVALLARLAYWILVTRDWVPQNDADQYFRLARSLADGDGYQLVYPQLDLHATAYRPPLLPIVLTPGAWLFDGALWPARLLIAIIGSATAVLAAVLANRVGGRRAGIVAGLAVALYPPLLANDTVTLTEPLALLLLLGALLLADDDHWVLAGLTLGAGLLTRPNGYVMVLVVAVWVGTRLGWRRGLGLAAIAVLCLAPWMVRNKVQVDTWRPYTSDGFTLAAVYALPAQRTGHFVDPVWDPGFDDMEHRLAQFDEGRWSDLLTGDAVEGVKTNPDYVWYTLRRNFRGYFEINPSLNTYPEVADGRNLDFRRPMLPLFYAVTVLGIAGFVRFRRDRACRGAVPDRAAVRAGLARARRAAASAGSGGPRVLHRARPPLRRPPAAAP